MTIPQHPVVELDEDILGGTPVFSGTRVPIKALVDYLEAGEPLSEFLEDYPTVSHEHAIAVLRLAKDMLFEYARSA
jgi:uncharacterized protein (DUF433 family)